MSGGYAHDIDAIVTIHANTIRTAASAFMAQHFRLLTEQQVQSLLPMSDLITAMEAALARFSAGEVLQPVRTVLTVGPTKAYFGLMPAFVPNPGSLGAKLVTVFGDNPKKNLPSHLATILLLDPETGSLQALMDGRFITEARTAAVSAVSARFLARRDASTMAIIGTGVQARSHLEAFAAVRELKDVRVWSPKAQSRERFVNDMSGHVNATTSRHRDGGGSRARSGSRRARDVIGHAGDRGCLGRPRHSRRLGWRLPADSARDGADARCARAAFTWIRAPPPSLNPAMSSWVWPTACSAASHIRGELGEVVLGRVEGRTDGRRSNDLQVAGYGR